MPQRRTLSDVPLLQYRVQHRVQLFVHVLDQQRLAPRQAVLQRRPEVLVVELRDAQPRLGLPSQQPRAALPGGDAAGEEAAGASGQGRLPWGGAHILQPLLRSASPLDRRAGRAAAARLPAKAAAWPCPLSTLQRAQRTLRSYCLTQLSQAGQVETTKRQPFRCTATFCQLQPPTCPWGSISSGERVARVTRMPFCTDRSSEGRPSTPHSPISISSARKEVTCGGGVFGAGDWSRGAVLRLGGEHWGG